MTQPMPPLVSGARIVLRELTPADEEQFTARVRASVHLHRPWVSPAASAEAFQHYLARVGTDFKALLACRKRDDAIVGAFNLSQIVYGKFCNAYLSYYAFTPFDRQGYMTEAMRLILRYAFQVLKLHRLEANIQPENKASIRLVERCGFQLEGYSPRYLKIGNRWRDHQRWAIRSELRRHPPSSTHKSARTVRTAR